MPSETKRKKKVQDLISNTVLLNSKQIYGISFYIKGEQEERFLKRIRKIKH